MTALIYLEKVVLCSALLYGYYHLALRNNRFHHWNRYYLMLITLVSLVTPLLQIPLPGSAEQPSAVVVYTSKIITLREAVAAPATDPSDYLRITLSVIYALIVAFLLYRLCAGIFGIRRLIRSSEVQEIPPFRFARSPRVKAPFSFFRYIFWDTDVDLDSPENKQVLQHELVHLREKHSIDKMLLEVVTAFCWINPFFHLIKRELSLVHEFIADQKAAGNEVAGYAENILRNAFNSRQFSITNDFFHPPIKRRIFMLTQFRQPRFSYLRRILVLPVSVLIFCSLAFVVDQRPSAIRALVPSGSLLNDNMLPDQPAQVSLEPLSTDDDTTRPKQRVTTARPMKEVLVNPFKSLTVTPSFPGGEDEMGRFLSRTIRYPKEAQEKGIEGLVTVHFFIEADGRITRVTTSNKSLGGGLEEEAIRVIAAMPRWKPAEIKGKKVSIDYSFPIRFTLKDNVGNIALGVYPDPIGQPVKTATDEIFTFVENPPTFVGGEEALSQYLSKNIRYPEEAVKKGKSGTVFVQFVVNKEGKVIAPKTVGTAKGYGLEEEAIRVVKEMPDWTAGKQNGRKVAVQFNLPIRFQIQ